MTAKLGRARVRRFSIGRVLGIMLCAIFSIALCYSIFVDPASWGMTARTKSALLIIGNLIVLVGGLALFVDSVRRGTLREIVLCLPSLPVVLFLPGELLRRAIAHYLGW